MGMRTTAIEMIINRKGSSWLDGVNGILMQQETNSLKQDFWNRTAIASLANTLITVMEPVPMPFLSSMLLLQL
jgi:hypothetical protein